MNFCGVTDSPESVVDELTPCRCGSVARINGGLCVSCLLQRGVHPKEPQSETFDAVLAEIEVRDTDWQLGNYQILEEIGRGGMGVIYRARQRHSRRIVALKRVLRYHADSRETLERFRREAEAAASLDHPNILPIYEVGKTEDGLPFFSMKYAPGGSLQRIAPALRNEPRQSVQLLAKVARAVQYAHEQGVLHRDLKPGNILLDGRGEPLVSDFGLAKWINSTSDLTQTMTVFGTPGYIAPEQVQYRAENLGAAVDVYSLGSILFDLLSGRPPFLGEHALAVIKQAAENPAPKLRSVAPQLDRDLETICARCLEREPLSRYASAGDLAQDLERWFHGRPIVARPVSVPVRLWRWSRRNRLLASAFGACVLLALAMVARQSQTHRLQEALWNNATASHSLALIPFLDLDGVRPDAPLAADAAQFFQHEMSIYGPCRVTVINQPSRHWTGAALQDELKEASGESKSRLILSGTRRRIGEKLRVSLHLVAEDGTDVLGSWVIETPGTDPREAIRATAGLGRSIYKLLDSKERATATAEDPVMSNERARKFFVAGRDLIGRRTIAELDRAISCLENAVREEPRSISARSFLAMACMGRDLLCTKPDLAVRAVEEARRAVRLAPENPTAHRALCVVYVSYGHSREALEHGFQSVEFGDRSERAFGQIAYTWKVLGRPDLAVRWYNKAKLSQHQPADYDALLGDCWADLRADSNAQREYESAASFHPDQPDGWMGLCRLKLLAGDADAARQIYRAELPRYPDFSVAKELAAMVEFFARNFAEAERLYAELAKNDQAGGGRGQFYGAIDYCSALGRLRIDSHDQIGARELLQQSAATAKSQVLAAPDDAATRYRLAAAEASLGETASCLRDLRAAIDAGWIDYRSARLDPRFDQVSGTREFQNILSELAAHAAMLGRQSPAAVEKVNEN